MSNFKVTKQKLERELEKLFLHIKNRKHIPNKIYSIKISADIHPAQFVNWLEQQPFSHKIYWADRWKHFITCGVGIADKIQQTIPVNVSTLFARMEKVLEKSNGSIRYYGGLFFDVNQPPNQDWAEFYPFQFIVPRFELVSTNQNTYLTCNLRLDKNQSIISIKSQVFEGLDKLAFSTDSVMKDLPPIISRTDRPNFKKWNQNVVTFLNILGTNQLSKIVLARKTELELQNELEPSLLFKYLIQSNKHAYNFYFQPVPGIAFLGVTPEQLYKRRYRAIFSEAIAGTRPRSKNRTEDRTLTKELLNSEKDLREHRWVSEMVEMELNPLCTNIDVLTRETVLKLSHVQHLFTRFRGRLLKHIGDGEIIRVLHPTPAVGGHPRDEAMEQIAKLEPFHRGWYAGQIGWVGKNAAEFAVGIRSALVRKKSLALFAGSGIVTGSVPDKEWEENENKILNFTRLFENGNGKA